MATSRICLIRGHLCFITHLVWISNGTASWMLDLVKSFHIVKTKLIDFILCVMPLTNDMMIKSSCKFRNLVKSLANIFKLLWIVNGHACNGFIVRCKSYRAFYMYTCFNCLQPFYWCMYFTNFISRQEKVPTWVLSYLSLCD
jgi:hypothetical protein